eukprot:1194252-Prorocentrum_minimum.AAC.11
MVEELNSPVGNNVDVKGNNVDVKGNNMDVKGLMAAPSPYPLTWRPLPCSTPPYSSATSETHSICWPPIKTHT